MRPMKTSLACLALAAATVAAGPARAADRPHLVTISGAAEEDDDDTWAVESWLRRAGRQRSFTLAPEYSYDPKTSVQIELTRIVDRDEGNGHEIEIELKHLFNRIARDGFGWGLAGILQYERPSGGHWTRESVSLSVPVTFAIGEGDGFVHMNVGVAKPRERRRFATGALAAEREVAPRVTLFGEWARDAGGRLVHGGVRYWIRRERLAVDIAWQRLRGEESGGSGIVLGLARYDL